MLEARSLRKATVRCSLLEHPSPGNLQSTRLALHVMDCLVANRCPHRSEIQSIALAETESSDCLILGSVDSYGHLIVSKLDASGKDVDRLTFSVLPRDCGLVEGGWVVLCCPRQWSMAVVARSFCKSIDVYDQEIHLQTLRTLWYPSSISFMQSAHAVEMMVLY